jgi:ubiquinone/menaquinone biosynthesis C-methylase UbiE
VSRDDVRTNRASWDEGSDEYQSRNSSQLNRWDRLGWGAWDVLKDDVHALGDVAGLDALELGCGAAQFGIKVVMRGAKVTGLDFSETQLRYAVANIEETGVRYPLVQASAEELPFPDERFDLVFCDHGATSFTDPHITVPEAARVLRPGGMLVFDIATPFIWTCWGDDDEPPGRVLRRDYFSLGRNKWVDDEEGPTIEWQLTYGAWIRLFRESGLVVEDLIELRPPEDAKSTYDFTPLDWARAFPGEHIWKVRKG